MPSNGEGTSDRLSTHDEHSIDANAVSLWRAIEPGGGRAQGCPLHDAVDSQRNIGLHHMPSDLRAVRLLKYELNDCAWIGHA
jgi:hypothetical protein